MDTQPKNHDDLTQITGIGEARQLRLQQSLGVQTFQDLAELPAAEIQADLKAGGLSASRNTIKSWQAEARQHISSTKQTTQTLVKPEVHEKRSILAHEGQWETAAAFIVEFQDYCRAGKKETQRTKIHHVQSGKEKVWSSTEGQELMHWMLSQPEGKPQPVPTAKTINRATPGAATTSPAKQDQVGVSVNLPVTQVKAYQPLTTSTPIIVDQTCQLFPRGLRGDEPFALEASFEFEDALQLANHKPPVQFEVGFSVDNRSTGANIHLGTTKPKELEKAQASYAARLDELVLPPGIYRLQVLVTMLTTPRMLSFLEIPLLQVV